jgi:hypothetical protein
MADQEWQGVTDILGLGKVGSKALDVSQVFLEKLIGPALENIGEGLAAPLVVWKQKRIERAQATLRGAAAHVIATGGQVNPVPGRILFPLLERSSLEEDSQLHEKWVLLLANATSTRSSVLPSFVSILAELSPTEAAILDHVFSVTVQRKKTGIKQPYSGAADELYAEYWRLKHRCDDEEIAKALELDYVQYQVLSANLRRLALIQSRIEMVPEPYQTVKKRYGTDDMITSVECTTMGYAFMNAVSDEPDQDLLNDSV